MCNVIFTITITVAPLFGSGHPNQPCQVFITPSQLAFSTPLTTTRQRSDSWRNLSQRSHKSTVNIFCAPPQCVPCYSCHIRAGGQSTYLGDSSFVAASYYAAYANCSLCQDNGRVIVLLSGQWSPIKEARHQRHGKCCLITIFLLC